MWWALLFGCGSAAPPPYDGAWVSFDEAPARGLHTTFEDQQDWLPRADDAFAMRAACPTIQRARITPFNEQMRWLELEGDRLDAVEAGVALLPNDKQATIRVDKKQPGVLGMPIACDACDVLLVTRAPDRHLVACEGPSRAVRIAGGPTAP